MFTMKITIFAIGKIKEKYLKDGINEYLLRLKNYVDIDIVELADSPVKDNPNESDIKKCKDEEGKRVLAKLKPSSYIIGLDLNKKEMDSIEFAKYIDKKMVEGKSHINFVIGGSYGLSDELKNSLSLVLWGFSKICSGGPISSITPSAIKITLSDTFFAKFIS